MSDAERLWELCAEALQPMVSAAAWRMWFTGIRPRSCDGDRFVLTVPSALAKERLQALHLGVITDVASEATGTRMAVDLVVCPDDHAEQGTADPATGPPGRSGLGSEAPDDRALDTRMGHAEGHGGLPGVPSRPAAANLNPNFSFDAFVVGDSNRLTHDAARVVAEMPGHVYNPLVIYGNSGLGKTHLLHAIGNYVHSHFPTLRIQCMSTERMMNEFVEAIGNKTTADFRRRYRGCDTLLLDDFQFIITSEKLREEVFYTFNELQESFKQIVIVSDRPPALIDTLDERLRSRLMSGLAIDVQPPDFETRLAILRKKAERLPTVIPDDVLELIATRVTHNIRELEGALTRIAAAAYHHRKPLGQEEVDRALADFIGDEAGRPITPDLVLDAAVEEFGFSAEELRGPSRRRPLVLARQVAMYVLRELTEHSYPEIALAFGGRDHTTVIHAVKKIDALMPERRNVFDMVQSLRNRVNKH